jgi:restriction endonuclease S subunit
MKEQLAIAALLNDVLAIQSERDRADRATGGLLDALGRKLFAHPSNEWPTVQLGDHAEICRGIRADTSATPSGFYPRCISPTNLKNGSLDLTNAPEVDIAEDNYQRTTLRTGDILLPVLFHSSNFPSNMTIWRDAMPDCVYSDRLIRIRCASPLSASYAYFALSAQGNYLRQLASSVGDHSRIDPSLLRHVQLRVPPMDLQREFDELLRLYLSLMERQEQCRATLASLFHGILLRTFSGYPRPVPPRGGGVE